MNKSQFCAGCEEEKIRETLKCCSICKNTLHCSKECLEAHWPSHKIHCKPYACSAVRKQATKLYQKAKCQENSAQEKTPTVRELVGKRCIIRCYVSKQKVQALWDTGSQVCAIEEIWKASYLPDVPLRDVTEFIDPLDSLRIEAANAEYLLTCLNV